MEALAAYAKDIMSITDTLGDRLYELSRSRLNLSLADDPVGRLFKTLKEVN
jgi:hypothetical protein